MTTWLRHLWGRVSGSLWFMPVVMSLGAVALAGISLLVDDAVAKAARSEGYLYGGDVESARTLLSTVASSVINVAGVSFSVTMVALSLTSSQFGPHLLANFMRDRGNQVVLGGFIATFLFCLLALGMTTGEAEATASVTATMALGLAGFSLVLLIYFIHHIATSMHADHVVEQVAEQAQRALDALFPEAADPHRDDAPARLADPLPGLVRSPRTGYIQAIDEAGLIRLAARHDVGMRLLRRPGHYVIDGSPLVAVSADCEPDAELFAGIRASFILGGHRTAEQDAEYGIHQLVEVAVRALSPSVNDPYTVISCVDRLTGIMSRIGPRPVRAPVRLDQDGTPRLEVDSLDFTGILDAAFHQIRQFSTDSPAVTIRILEGLALIATTLDDAARKGDVARHGTLVMEAQRGRHQHDDQQVLNERFEALERALRAAPSCD